nr:MFS transporter [Candidatus Sigynarchaeota archaeon]
SVYRTSFTKVLISCLYAIAVPNILIFRLDVSPLILGLASAINAFAYIGGPALFSRLSVRLGARRAIITLGYMELVTLAITTFFLSAVSLIIVNILDGILASLFWTNMSVIVGRWQDNVPREKKSAVFRNYGLSWSLGAIAGEIIGCVVIFTGLDDRVVLAIGFLLAIVQLPMLHHVSIPAARPSEQQKIREGGAKKPAKNTRAKQASKSVIFGVLLSPLLLMIVGELSLQVIKSTYDFLFPFIVFENGASSGLVYSVSLLQQVAQMTGIYVSSRRGIKGQYYGALASIGAVALLTTHMLVISAPLAYAAALVFVGLASGLIYGFTAQVMLRHSNNGSSIRIAGMYETLSGIGDGMMIIITGFSSEQDYSFPFATLACYLAITFLYFSACVFVLFRKHTRGSRANPRYEMNPMVLFGGIRVMLLNAHEPIVMQIEARIGQPAEYQESTAIDGDRFFL